MSATDVQILEELNRGYLRAAETSDVRWYDEHLTDDFLATNPDGSLIDKATFLKRVAGPYRGSQLEAIDVRIRLFGDVALIHAGFRDKRSSGEVGQGRYTDIYARRDGRWLCVAAHFTRF
ncbi:MAG: nuclear transport factor 2 family protein [Candidatus Rokubacteria bacterium]|nr:nuclear transport factor 2 family protein [Candidatus Rokubacteria bacterium]